MQDAVNAVADTQFLLKRLNMDIRGPLLHRPRDHDVDEADDRGLAGQVAQVGDNVLILFEIATLPIVRFQAVGRPVALGTVGAQCVEQLTFARQPAHHTQTGRLLQGFDRVDIPRVGHGGDELAVLDTQWTDACLAKIGRVNRVEGGRILRKVAHSDQRRPVVVGQHGQQIVLRHEAEFEQQTLHGFATFLLDQLDPTQIVGGQLAGRQQQLIEPTHHDHPSKSATPGAPSAPSGRPRPRTSRSERPCP